MAFNIHGFPAFAWNDGTGEVCPPRLGHLYLAPSSPSRMRRSSLSSASAFSSFRVSASVFSVKFRVNPWLILLHSLLLISVKFRVRPWQSLLLLLLLLLSCQTPSPLPSALKPIHCNSSILIYLKTMVLIKLCIPNN